MSLQDSCYWCGGIAVNEDHVPAKGFLLKQTKAGELISVPSCNKHNKQFSGDEEWLRNYMTAITSDIDGLEIWKTRGFPSLRRNRNLLKEMRQNIVQLNNGRHAGKFSKRRARRVIEKIVRGLFYYIYKQPLGRAYFRYWFNPKVNLLSQYANRAKFYSIQKGVFRWAIAAAEDPGNAIWWIEFYRSNLFVVAFTRKPV